MPCGLAGPTASRPQGPGRDFSGLAVPRTLGLGVMLERLSMPHHTAGLAGFAPLLHPQARPRDLLGPQLSPTSTLHSLADLETHGVGQAGSGALSTPLREGRSPPATGQPDGSMSGASRCQRAQPSKNKRPTVPPGGGEEPCTFHRGEGSATAEAQGCLRRELQTCAVTPLGRKSCSSRSSDRTPKTEASLSATRPG